MPSPKQLAEQDRDFAYRRGDVLNQQAEDRGRNQGNVAEYYRGYGGDVYDPLIGGQGGYSPQEREAILREGETTGALTSDEDFGGNYLSDQEYAGIAGNPYDRYKSFNPGQMEQMQRDSAGYQRGAVDQMGRGLEDSITPDLGLSDEFGGSVDRTLTDTEGRVRGAVDPSRLRSNLGKDYLMDDGEKERIVTGAGISAGTGYRAGIQDIERRSRAAGVDPVGVGALRARYEREAAGEAGDAMTQARIKADEAQANRSLNYEQDRRAGETGAAGMVADTEMNLGGRRLNSDYQREGMRLDTARDVSNRRAGAAETTGKARLANETNVGNAQQDVARYNTDTGTRIATGIEQDQAARAALLAQNRQGISQGNQAAKYQQRTGTSNILAGRNMDVANAKRADAQEGRGYLREQGAQANQNQQAEANRQVQTYGTQAGAAQGATANAVRADQTPKWWEKAIGAGAQVAKAASYF